MHQHQDQPAPTSPTPVSTDWPAEPVALTPGEVFALTCPGHIGVGSPDPDTIVLRIGGYHLRFDVSAVNEDLGEDERIGGPKDVRDVAYRFEAVGRRMIELALSRHYREADAAGPRPQPFMDPRR